jgi:hypothetical protein
LAVSARLFADTDAGDRLSVARASMGAGMLRRGSSAIWKRYTGPPLPEDPEAQRQMLEGYRVRDALGHSTLAVTDRYLRDVAPMHVIDTMRARSWQGA